MTEYRLFPVGEVPHVSTPEFHADRERAAHLEQDVHRGRLELARDFVLDAASCVAMSSLDGMCAVSDLGCGDGGLLSLLAEYNHVASWGYDFHAPSAAGWVERGVAGYLLNAFDPDPISRAKLMLGDVVVCTEVLEHLADPHGVARWLATSGPRYLVASSPHTETDRSHDACHAWAWDMPGYRDMLAAAGWKPLRHKSVGMFQVMLARSW